MTVKALQTMRSLLLCDIGQLELRNVPRPEPKQHEVLVRVSAVGLCGTDFHIFSGQTNYNRDKRGIPIPLVEQPQIMGHEIVGVVEAVGYEVRDLRIGDRVVLDQGLNCVSGSRQPLCEYCASDDSHQCQFYDEHGITGLAGGLAEYIAIPAVNAIRINSNISNVEAALAEPLGCIVHASDMVARSRTRYVIGAQQSDSLQDSYAASAPGYANASRQVQSILIFGAGPAGLLFTQYLRNVLGYDGLLLVSEPNAQKRELAAGYGAEAIDPLAVDLTEVVQEKTGGRRVEYLIDACGAGSVFRSIHSLIRKQATVLLYGYGHGGVDLSVLNNLQFMEARLVTTTGASGGFDSDGRPSTYRKALSLIEAKQIDIASWVTHRYQSLEAVPQAFAIDHQASDYVKGVVVLEPER